MEAKTLSHGVAQVSTPLSSQERCELKRSDGSVPAATHQFYSFICAINSHVFCLSSNAFLLCKHQPALLWQDVVRTLISYPQFLVLCTSRQFQGNAQQLWSEPKVPFQQK